MRGLLIALAAVAAVLGTAWIGGESWLAVEAARRIADDPRISAGAVTPLRDPRRIGLHLSDLTMATDQGTAALPTLDLWAAPSAPTQINAGLPPAMTLPIGGVLRHVEAAGAVLSLRFSPTSGMAINRAAAVSGPVSLDGTTVADRIDFSAVLTAMGPAAPRTARASYRVQGQLDGIAAAGAAVGAGGDALSAQGGAQVYLTGPIVPGAASRPQVVGLSSDGVTLRVGARQMRLTGRIAADPDGRPVGAVFAYTADAADWTALAVQAGVLPEGAAGLAGLALRAAAAGPLDLPPDTPAPKDPQPGELRVPLLFRDGQMFLGSLPVGPAPSLPR